MLNIIDSAKSGNRDALEQIYFMYNKQVFYFCSKLVNESELANNLTFDTFQCAFDRINTLEEADQLELWIKNIAAIKCFNYIHKMKPMLFLHSAEPNEEALFSLEEIEKMEKGALDETISCNLMDKMLQRLDDAQRMTIMFHYFNALSIPQIAKIMSCTEEMVRERLKIGAARMKQTILLLAENEIKISQVDFRAAIGLMAACARVPEAVEEKILSFIAEISTPDVAPIEEKDYSEEYSFDNYVSSLDRQEPGELEAAISRFTAYIEKEERQKKEKELAAALGEQIEEQQVSEKISESLKTKSASLLVKFLSWFKGFNMMQQSIALIIIIGIIAAIIVGFSLGKNKKPIKKDEVSSTISSVVSQVESKPEVIKPVYKVEIEKTENNLKAEDDTVIAKAAYELPVVTISTEKEAEKKINDYLVSQKDAIHATYASEQKILECNYAYEHQHYGPYIVNETTIKSTKTRADEQVISIEQSKYTYAYGNVHGEDELSALNFNVKTGELLKAEDILSDKTGYEDIVTNFICTELEKNQSEGKYTMYDDYRSVVRTTVMKDGRWLMAEDGIKVIFNSDEIVYYDLGIQTFTVPYGEINQYLLEDYQK